MVATVQIVEKNGAGGTQTDKTTSGTVRFKNADNATVDAANPMVVPTSGSDFSYEKWLRLNVTVAPDNNLTNLAAYSDGSVFGVTGVAAYAKAVTAYSTPAEATTTTGYALLSSYTAAGTLSLGAATVTGTGEKGDHLVLMLKVDSTANPGTLSAETLTFQYDEL